jgi:hypothetical protein
MGLKTLEGHKKHPTESPRPHRIEHVPARMVPGKLRHAKQGLGILVCLGLLVMALGLQKRRRWRVKDAPGTPGGILDAGARVGHGDLLGSQGITTFTSVGVVWQPRTSCKPKLQLLVTKELLILLRIVIVHIYVNHRCPRSSARIEQRPPEPCVGRSNRLGGTSPLLSR